MDDAFKPIANVVNGIIEAFINPLSALARDTGMLVDAAVQGKLATRADASKHHGDYRKIVEGVNQTLDAVIGPLNVAAEYVDRISKGDIPPRITDSYNGDFNEIKNNLNNCIDIMNNLLKEAGRVVTAAADGQLDERANADLFVGGWNKLVVGVNEIVTNIVNPLMVTADYVDKVSKGIIPPEITDNLQGPVQCHQEQPECRGEDDERASRGDGQDHPGRSRRSARQEGQRRPLCGRLEQASGRG